ncbi:MAG TPA: cellulase family glycosylhydrolase [Candidatus Binatia bacterium]|nr:cellulase family glycosylhydrolase [Candidatus Binatia bacterium]
MAKTISGSRGLLVLAIAAMASMTCVSGPRPRPTRRLPGGFVVSSGGHLRLGAVRYRFVGVNVYSLASAPPGSDGFVCGESRDDDGLRQTLDEVAAMGGNAIRIDAYQSFTDGDGDFSRLDLILDEAGARGIRVILALENQWPDCTEGGYKYADWYRDGYRRPYGGYRLSYRDHVAAVVRRYRDDPGVLMFQLMNEAESRDVHGLDDPEALLAFTEDMASLVRGIDRVHVLSLGTSGVARPGSGGAFYALLHQVNGIDVVEAHDYGADAVALPRDVWLSLLAARAIRRPFFIGEVGMDAPPLSPEQRATLVAEKLEAAWHEDADGALVWSYRAGDGGNKDFDFHDPLAAALRRFSHEHRIRSAGAQSAE